MPEYKGHIESDETEPTVAGHKLKVGQKFEVKAVSVKESQLGATAKVGARLCGGTDTCLALTEV
jgi:hypothetical protein